ncbi:MAG: hypothetical protein HQ559_11415, partial [Lentisphaerae bacterium]|nr:hypothetical protein [Lentisphaerota bacterium]
MSAKLGKTDRSGKPVEKKFNWKKVLAGVWRGTAGSGSSVSMLSVAGVKPRAEAIAKMGSGAMPFKGAAVGWRKTGDGLLLSFPLDRTEKIYGLGLNFETLDQR